MKKYKENPYKQYMETFGDDWILQITIEEMSELTKAICKYKRMAVDDTESKKQQLLATLYDCIADVEICIEELAYIFDGFDEIEKIRLAKIEKGKEKVKEYKERKLKQ